MKISGRMTKGTLSPFLATHLSLFLFHTNNRYCMLARFT